MTDELETVHARATALLGTVERRELGRVRAAETIAFARACAEDDPRYLDSDHPAFAIHPLYLPSLLRGPWGARDDEYRPDGMFAGEVPGTAGLEVRLLAGGQSIDFHRPPPLGEEIEVRRTVDRVEWKGRADGRFVVITIRKTYRADSAWPLASVTEGFIVR
ncbi:FAS1-like dehydratase domain-containing protein [Nocardia testacea]|uniref:FAS1-like dehydratase domain-containing protein n=1 Tax=Nocardia testacea TaxID=248551 RepID=UPI00031A8303|nr:MaoC family dehydratase N-terminal domain-containing protein [Nocardia testacea]